MSKDLTPFEHKEMLKELADNLEKDMIEDWEAGLWELFFPEGIPEEKGRERKGIFHKFSEDLK